MIWNDHYYIFSPLVPKLSAQAERLGTHLLLKLRFNTPLVKSPSKVLSVI